MPEPTGTENAGITAGATGTVETGTAGATGTESATPSAPGSALASLQKISAAASSAAKPDTTTVIPKSADAGTTVQPGQPGANSGAQGEDASWLAIPEARREVILKNTREKAKEEALREVESTIGWAKDVKREDVAEAFNFASSIHQNPVAFAVQLVGELLENPQARAALVQHLGPILAGGQPGGGKTHQFRSQDGRFVLPEGRLTDESGKVRAYSGDQVAEILQNFESHLDDKYGGRIQPLEDRDANLQEREAVMQVIHESREEGATLMTEMRAMPNWPKDGNGGPGEQKIAKYLSEIPVEVKKRIGAHGTMLRAFHKYLEVDVIPTLASTTTEQVRADQLRKAAASTGSVQPGNGTVTPPAKKPTNVSELSKHLASLAGQGTA